MREAYLEQRNHGLEEGDGLRYMVWLGQDEHATNAPNAYLSTLGTFGRQA